MDHPNVIEPKIISHNIVARKLVQDIVLLKSNKHYRFGDVIFKKGYYWKKSRDYIVNNDQFNNSILQTYLNSISDKSDKSWNTNESSNIVYKNLNTIINNYILNEPTIQLPLPNELVIHLRTGDWAYTPNFLNYDYTDLINKYIKTYNITKCTFCTAFHYGDYSEKNLWIYNEEIHNINVNKLTELFTKVLDSCNITLNIQSNINPDLDFIYILKADHFIGRDGGFSKIISILRQNG